jgi:hypothetical protein
MTKIERLEMLLAVAADDMWPLCVGREDCGTLVGPGTGAFRLFINVNDTFAPAADEELVPISDERTVYEMACDSGDVSPAVRDARLIEWVAQRRGLTPPYHWRARLEAAPTSAKKD